MYERQKNGVSDHYTKFRKCTKDSKTQEGIAKETE